MAKRKNAGAEIRLTQTAYDRIANVLGLLLVKDLGPSEAILKLDAVGFDAITIALLLNTTANNIAVVKYNSRKKKMKKN